jgi:hypothetical protein
LQVACLETVIAAPIALVVPLLPHAAPAFEVYYHCSVSVIFLLSCINETHSPPLHLSVLQPVV